jgi:hypothetical protein
MDALIVLGGALNARDYRTEGLTLERLGLAGIPPGDLEPYLQDGIGSRPAARSQVDEGIEPRRRRSPQPSQFDQR